MIPSVTIAIPIYNEGKYIQKTLLSALDQTHDNLKIVISDNCSNDGSFQVIQQLVSNHQNVTLIRQEKSVTAAENFRFLLTNCETEFFCWLGGHDLLDKSFIEKAVQAFLNNKNVSLVFPKSEFIDTEGKPLGKFSFDDLDTTQLDEVNGPLKVAANTFYCSSVNGLFKTEVLKKYYFKSIVGTDHLIIYHAAIRGKLFFLSDVTNLYRVVRKEEQKEILERYKNIGLIFKSKDNPYQELCDEFMRSTLLNTELKFNTKVRLLMKLPSVLKSKFNYQRFSYLIKAVPYVSKIKNKLVGTNKKA